MLQTMPRDFRKGFDSARRRLLKQLATGALVASAASPLSALLRRNGAEAGTRQLDEASRTVREGRVLELAQLLQTTPREKVFDVTVEQIQKGATHREVLGGTLLAGIRDVNPRPAGTKFHVVLMISSALELAQASAREELWLPVFFNIHTLKNSQERDIREGDWELPPAPAPATDDPAEARKALAATVEAWDEKQADRAATAAAQLLDLDDLFEILWPIGARDFRNVGHKMIHTSQIYRALKMMDGQHRVPVVRSLVYGLLWGTPGTTTAAFDENRKRIHELPSGWDSGRLDPEASRELLTLLRTASSEQALSTVIELIRRGVSPASIWDGLRLIASEILFRLARSRVRNAQLLGVHPLTTLNAYYVAYERTRRDETRRLLLLQAVAWMPLFRESLKKLKGLSMEGAGFDGLEEPADPITVRQAVLQADTDYVRSASMVLRVAREPEQAEQFIDQCRSLVLHKSLEHHNHKYSVAAFEEFRHTHPRWSPYLLATCLSYLPTPGNEDSDVYKRTRAALSRLRA